MNQNQRPELICNDCPMMREILNSLTEMDSLVQDGLAESRDKRQAEIRLARGMRALRVASESHKCQGPKLDEESKIHKCPLPVGQIHFNMFGDNTTCEESAARLAISQLDQQNPTGFGKA